MNHYVCLTGKVSVEIDKINGLMKNLENQFQEMNITGLLMVIGQNVMAVFEGEKQIVEDIFNKWATNGLNKGAQLLSKGDTQDRLYESWNNICLNKNIEDGFENHELVPFFAGSSKHYVKELSKSFYQNHGMNYSSFWAGN